MGHSLLVIFYHMLKSGTRYPDLGADYFDRREPECLTRYYVKRLESLGHRVTLETCVPALPKFSEQKLPYSESRPRPIFDKDLRGRAPCDKPRPVARTEYPRR